MTGFCWTDRHGVVHDLVDHAGIEQEWQEVRQELLDLRARLKNLDDAIFIAADAEAAALRSRLGTLRGDLRGFVRHEAARASTMIDQIELEASFLRVLHRSYDQRDKCGDDDAALAAAPTADQISVLKRQAIRDGRELVMPATLGEAHAMLLAAPATRRVPLPGFAPAFEWTDREGHFHQVRDLRQIEREYATIAAELASLKPRLAPEHALEIALMALEEGRLAVRRVSILEDTMNRWSNHIIDIVRADHISFLDDLEASDGSTV